MVSHTVRRESAFGSQSCGNSAGASRRTLPAPDVRMPASAIPATLVFLAVEESFGYAVLPFCKTRLLEPGQRPAGVGVEVSLLLRKRLVQGFVDEGESLPDGHRCTASVSTCA